MSRQRFCQLCPGTTHVTPSALLARAGQTVRYASGRIVAAMSGAYVGEGKTDAKDAYVIAETARLRRDLTVIDTSTDQGPQPRGVDRTPS